MSESIVEKLDVHYGTDQWRNLPETAIVGVTTE